MRSSLWSPLREDNYERFSRQIVLIGAPNQKKIESATVTLSGDPSIVETAAEYLRAAGIGSISRGDAETVPSEAIADGIVVRVTKDGIGIGTGAPSPLADQFELTAAGMLLAVEVLKKIIGQGTASASIPIPKSIR